MKETTPSTMRDRVMAHIREYRELRGELEHHRRHHQQLADAYFNVLSELDEGSSPAVGSFAEAEVH